MIAFSQDNFRISFPPLFHLFVCCMMYALYGNKVTVYCSIGDQAVIAEDTQLYLKYNF